MKRLTLVILSLFLACSFAQAQETAEVTIEYGDGYIKAHPAFVRVVAGGEIIVTLVPDTRYAVMEVELKARKKEEKWLKKAVRASDLKDKSRKFEIKVPKNQPAGIYKYYVKVPGVGYLDPRIEVIGLH